MESFSNSTTGTQLLMMFGIAFVIIATIVYGTISTINGVIYGLIWGSKINANATRNNTGFKNNMNKNK